MPIPSTSAARPTRATWLTRAIVAAVIALLAAACVPPPPSTAPAKFTWSIDTDVRPLMDSLPGGPSGQRTLAAVRDAQGVESTFLVDEVVIRTSDAAELDSFLARTGGVVIDDDAVPPEALEPGDDVDPELLEPTQFTVRVDASRLDPSTLRGDMRAMGLVDSSRISSVEGAGLLALVAAEQRRGVDVVPDFVDESTWLESTTEGTPPSGSALDAMTEAHWSHEGSRSHVAAAWQWVGERTTVRRVKVAIIDAGFWLDPQGHPYETTIGSDFFGRPRQWDLIDDDVNAGGPNPGRCTNDSLCPWHGNDVAGAAVGLVDNAAGASGSGGTVADPILLKREATTSKVNEAIRIAVAMGADVVNMSFGRSCDFWCRTFQGDFELGPARSRGVVLVAAAGNLNQDSGSEHVQPCNLAGVICVGALRPGATTKVSYSNFGAPVDLFAPTEIRTMPTLDANTRWDGCSSLPENCFSTASGTSAAAPVVAGVAAMMKAVNPSLDGSTIEQMLRDSAFTDSPTPVVTRYLNALAAVRLAGGQSLRADVHEPDDTVTGLPLRITGTYRDLTIGHPQDMDHVRFLAGRSNMELRYRFPGPLGEVSGEVVRGTGSQCGEISLVGVSFGFGSHRRTFSVPPGEYLARTTGSDGNTLPYDLSMIGTARGLPSDTYEDNHSRERAARISSGGGERSATIGWSADQDWYRVQSTGGLFAPLVGGTQYRVAITATEAPLRIDVYDAAGEPVDSRETTATCTNLPSFTLPQGTFYLRVRSLAGETGAYRFTAQQTYTQGRLYDQRGVFEILLDPSIPVQYSLRTDALRVGFVATPSVIASNGIRVQSVDTYNRLLDGNGNVLAQGDPSSGGDVFDPELLEPGEAYLLETERVDGDGDPGYVVPVTVSLEAGERTVAAGDEHSCAVIQGAVSCWGNDASGQLGDGENLGGDRYAAVPVAIDTAASAVQVAAGQDFTCALLVTTTVQCWGANYAGQLGQGSPGPGSSEPVPVPDLDGVRSLTAGSRHVCALRDDGVWCWGANPDGRLGRDTLGAPSGVPGRVDALEGVSSIAAGGAHTCAVSSGRVWCWGYNEHHQLGDDEVISSIAAIEVDGVESVHDVTAGFSHSCAVTVDGAVSCWGLGEDGQLGTDMVRSAAPVRVELGEPVHSVAAGARHTCAATTDQVSCWGTNDRLQLGGGEPADSSTTPRVVPGVAAPQALAVGADHSCAVEATELRCWGANAYGSIGDGTTSFSVVVPAAVDGLPATAAEIAAGVGHSCALLDDDTVWCWGRNTDGQLGDGDADGAARHQPAPVVQLGAARSVAAGGRTTCAVRDDRTVWCWGDNSYGQLGGGSLGGSSSVAVRVLVGAGQPLTGATSVAVGADHACARTEQGAAWCWGRGDRGQLGDGLALFGHRSAFAVGVFDAAGPISEVAAVTAGAEASCALRTDTTVVCWGTGWYGELGNGSTSSPYAASPVLLDGAPLSGASSVSLGSFHGCSTLTGGDLACWGANYSGQLGTGDLEDAATAALVSSIGDTTSIAAGGEHTCVVRTGADGPGGASCAGFGFDGPLGTMATADRWDHGLGVQDRSGVVSGFSTVAAGDTHTCGVRSGSVLCWGRNTDGQVGTSDAGARVATAVIGR